MMRSAVLRFAAISLGLNASLAGAALALAHGHAHSEALEHAAHHAASAPATEYPTAGASDHHQDHAHQRLDPTGTTRTVKDLPAIQARTVTIAITHVVISGASHVPGPNESPPERPGTSPPQSRAPPTL